VGFVVPYVQAIEGKRTDAPAVLSLPDVKLVNAQKLKR